MHSLQALRIIRISNLTRPRRTTRRPRPARASTLSVQGSARRARRRRGGGRAAGGGRRRRGAELALDKRQRRLAVLGPVALVRGGIAAVAAVRVGRVAVGLDLGGRGADEA